MKIHKVILTKSKLAALQQSERSLLLLLGHASNEINVLSRLILMITRKDGQPLPRTVDNVEAGQVCVLLRVLVGQLNEAWELFKKRVQADRSIARKYVEELDAEGAAYWSVLIGTSETALSPKSAKRSPSITQITPISRSKAFRLCPTPSR
jgi:hypothetical protein